MKQSTERAADKILAGLKSTVEHAKGKEAARYDCDHWHQSYAEAQECPTFLDGSYRRILG